MGTPTVQFQAGSTIMISGPTGAGKTYFTHRLLKNNMFNQKVNSILFCYGVYQEYYNNMSDLNIEFHKGLPSKEKVMSLNDGNFHIIVLDDLMEFITKSIDVQMLFTKYCHHFNISAIYLTQNIFAQGPCARTISLNTHILVVFANKRDESQTLNIGRQLIPSNVKLFLEVYEDATSEQYGYLIVDCSPNSPKQLKFRTHIFPGENTIAYIMK